jgi:hypothetical protein
VRYEKQLYGELAAVDLPLRAATLGSTGISEAVFLQ